MSQDFQDPELLKILDQVLITKEKDLKPFWNLQCKEKSNNLWYPKKTDLQDSDLNSLNLLSKEMVEKSWFSTKMIMNQKQKNLSKIFSALYTSSVVESMDLENTKNKLKKKCNFCDNEVYINVFCENCYEKVKLNNKTNKCVGINTNGNNCNYNFKDKTIQLCGHHNTFKLLENRKEKEELKKEENTLCRKIKIIPTLNQRQVLKHWFGVTRKYYNSAVCSLNEKFKKFPELRKPIKNEFDKIDYCSVVPDKIRLGGVEDALKGKSNAILKYKKTKEISNFKFRKKYDVSQSLSLDKNSVSFKNGKLRIFPTKMKESLEFRNLKGNEFLKIKKEKSIPKILNNCRLVMKHNSIFYLYIPFSIPKNNSKLENRIVALDPGIRNFQAYYSETSCGFLGIECRQRILKLKKIAFNLQSKIQLLKNSKTKNKWKLNKLKREWKRIISKPTRLLEDLHKKVSLFLCKNFDTILIPEFESQKIIKKMKSQKFKKEVIDTTLQLSHYKFRMFLTHKANLMNKNVIVVTEEYTSKTCGGCGNRKQVGKFYKCKCGFELDRDLNGARNIFIKNTTIQ